MREDAAFLQNKKVQSYHIAQSMAYIIIFVTAYVSYFLFKHSNTFRNKDVWTMKTLKENLWDTRMLKKKKSKFYYKHHDTDMQILIMLVAIIQISVPTHREVSFHIHHINTDTKQDLACCRQRSLVLESRNIKSGVT